MGTPTCARVFFMCVVLSKIRFSNGFVDNTRERTNKSRYIKVKYRSLYITMRNVCTTTRAINRRAIELYTNYKWATFYLIPRRCSLIDLFWLSQTFVLCHNTVYQCYCLNTRQTSMIWITTMFCFKFVNFTRPVSRPARWYSGNLYTIQFDVVQFMIRKTLWCHTSQIIRQFHYSLMFIVQWLDHAWVFCKFFTVEKHLR